MRMVNYCCQTIKYKKAASRNQILCGFDACHCKKHSLVAVNKNLRVGAKKSRLTNTQAVKRRIHHHQRKQNLPRNYHFYRLDTALCADSRFIHPGLQILRSEIQRIRSCGFRAGCFEIHHQLPQSIV